VLVALAVAVTMKATQLTNFTDLGLAPGLLKALAEEGYETPTPIQAKAIPAVLKGGDLLGIAQTGTGKTAAFALPILQRLAAEKRPPARKAVRALILSPTRELASQIAESFRTYGRHEGLSVGIVFGGVSQGPQRSMLARGVDVLVATPGRLIDHIQQGNVDLKTTEILVLDEADQMLDLGFLPPIRKIAARLSTRRQTLFFSATMPPEIAKLAGEFLRDPVKVSVAPAATTVERVLQKVIHVEQSKKKALLVEMFSDAALSRTLVFTRTKRGADKVAQHLEDHGINVAAIHGNKSQSQRERALADFKAGRIRGLVATDIAARGIDVDMVSHVINYELPDVPESYVHRIGRTARAGATGIALSLVDGDERSQLRDIERTTRQSIPSEDRRNDAGLTADKSPASPRERGVRGGPGGRGGERRGGAGAGRGNASRGGAQRGGHRRPERDGAAYHERPAVSAEAGAATNRPERAERPAGRSHQRPEGGAPRGARKGGHAAGHRGSDNRRSDRPAHSPRPDGAADRIHPAGERPAHKPHGQQDNQRNGIRFRTANDKAAHNGSSRPERRDARPASAELSGLGFMRRAPKDHGSRH